MTRPRILFLAHLPPWPTYGGGPVRTRCTLEALATFADVELATFLRPGADPVVPDAVRSLCRGRVHCVPLPRGRFRDAAVLLAGWLEPEPWRIARDRSRAMRAWVAERIDRVDAIHVDHLPMWSALPPDASDRVPVVLDCHNAEHRLFRGWTPYVPWYAGVVARRDAARLERYEATAVRRAAQVAATTEEDRAALIAVSGARADKVHVVPVGITVSGESPGPDRDAAPRLVAIGTWDWPPNRDALRWFVGEILPTIRRHRPGTTFEVAGRCARGRPPREATAEGVAWRGEVPSVDDFLRGATVCVAPLRCGAGIRIKALDSLARGVPVVATPMGAEGLPSVSGVRIVPDPEAFAQAVVDWMEHPEAASEAGAAAMASLDALHGRAAALEAWQSVYGAMGLLEVPAT